MKSVFIDSNLFIAFSNTRDANHERSLELMDGVRRGRLGTAYTSDYVFDEAVTAALIRTGRVDLAIKLGKLILGSEEDSIPSLARLIRVDERTFTTAWKTFKAGRFDGLSFTDHTILAHIKDLDIDSLMSFDSDFDGLTTRIS